MDAYAAVDVGSNTLRLLIARVEGKNVIPLVVKRRITRLGGGIGRNGVLDPDAIRNSLDVLREYSRDMWQHHVLAYRATATAAVRNASNRAELLDRTLTEAGLAIDVISGEEEARLTLAGVLGVVKAGSGVSMVFDVGGASTEFIRCKNGAAVTIKSIDLGAVTLTEQFLHDEDPPSARAVQQMMSHIQGKIQSVMKNMAADDSEFDMLIGTAGTVTTLAAMLQRLEEYDPSRINNYVIDSKRLRELLHDLVTMDNASRSLLPGLEPGRADIICAGGFIVLEIMNALGVDRMIASDAGLLEGIIFNLISKISM